MEDIFQEILLTTPKRYSKNKSQAQEGIVNTSAGSFIQPRRPLKFHPELVFRVRRHGEQIDPRVLSSHYGQHQHWTCCRD